MDGITSFIIRQGLSINDTPAIDYSGNWVGVTIPILKGGTGATNASAALGNLGAAPLASPAFTGTPTAPTVTATDNSNKIATTAFVKSAGGGSGYVELTGDVTGSGSGTITTTINNTVATGTYTSVTVNSKGLVIAGENPDSLAGYGISDAVQNLGNTNGILTDFYENRPEAGGLNIGTIFIAHNTKEIFYNLGPEMGWQQIGGTTLNLAPADSPAFTGAPTAPTPTVTDNSTAVATTEFVKMLISDKYSKTFNNTTDWGVASGGWYTISISEFVHGMGNEPLVQVQTYNGIFYTMSTPDTLAIYVNGDVTLSVPELPDERFTGRIIIL